MFLKNKKLRRERRKIKEEFSQEIDNNNKTDEARNLRLSTDSLKEINDDLLPFDFDNDDHIPIDGGTQIY